MCWNSPWGRWAWVGLYAVLAGCRWGDDGGYLERIRDAGELRLITRNAPTTYFEGRDGPAGLEYELGRAFAGHLGVKATFVVADHVPDIFYALDDGKGQIAAAGLTNTLHRTRSYLFGPSYQIVQQQLVCRRGGPRPESLADLAGLDLAVVAGTSYAERLSHIRDDHPKVTWEELPEVGTEQLLEAVWERQRDCTVADSNIVAINRRYFPELVVRMDMSEPEALGWVLPADARALQAELFRWFKDFKASGGMDDLLEKYYGHVEIFDYVDTRRFKSRVRHRLPRYRDYFRDAAERYGVSWTLLAAQAYQESHWRPRAKSPTGVRGMMMLTLPTAREVGIKSRLDARQSILGGTRYLVELKQRLPTSITEPDRTWIALAAYNVGMGHVYDARTLARRLDKDPDSWNELMTVLPLLAQKRYYKTVKYGYARGREPVRYVQRIRNFQDILERTVALSAQAQEEGAAASF